MEILSKRSSNSIKFCLLLANTLIIFVIAILFLATSLYIIGLSLTRFLVFGGAVLAGTFGWWNAKQYFIDQASRYYFILLFFAVVLILLSVLISGLFREFSSDGQTYHSFARIELFNGRNPYYEPSQEGSGRIDDFPLASWVIGTAIYKVTGRIDSSRAFNLILMLVGFLNSYVMFSIIDNERKNINVLFALLLIINPIAITQSLGFMLDGQVAMSLLVLIVQTFLMTRDPNLPLVLSFGANLILLINLKTTGLFYAIMWVVGMFLFYITIDSFLPFISNNKQWFTRRNLLGFFMKVVKKEKIWFRVVFISMILGVFFFGYTAYVKVIFEDRSLLGVVGNDLEGYLRAHPGNIPSNWLPLNPVERLFASIFSRSQLSGGGDAVYKIPFTMSYSEYTTFYSSENRVGGFGPFFGGAMILTMFSVIFVLRSPMVKKRFVLEMLFISLLILISVLVNPLAWQVRYAPQLWMFPVIVASCVLYYHRGGWIQYLLGWSLVFTLALNGLIVSVSYYSQQINLTTQLNNELQELKGATPVVLFASNRAVVFAYLLEENINYEKILDINMLEECNNILMLSGISEVKFCVTPSGK